MAGNPNFTEILSTTLSDYANTLEDNVFTSKPGLWALQQGGRVVEHSGNTIVQQLLYAESANKGSYADDDVFTTAANAGITAAEFPWKQYYALVHFNGIEIGKNEGNRTQLINLVTARLKQAEMTIAENIDQMFFGDGSGNTNKDWDGLEAIVDSADPSWGDLGGIDRATNTWWKATKTAAGGALSTALMRTLYNTVSEGNDHPTNVFTRRQGFEAYEALMVGQIRYEDTQMADAGFSNLMFKGAPVAFDTYVGSQIVYMVNLKYIELAKLGDNWFKPSDMVKPTNQDVFYKTLVSYGNFAVSNCKRQGKLTGVTDG